MGISERSKPLANSAKFFDADKTAYIRETEVQTTSINHVTESEKGMHQQNPSKLRPEVRHIGFLKVHKAASSTVQNILYRFGLKRNLSFVLPTEGHYISKFKYQYRQVMQPLPSDSGKYDILCNHVRFNLRRFEQYLHEDSHYIAIVREPLDLFLSAVYYYRFVWHFGYLTRLNADTFIHDLIAEPDKYEETPISKSYTFNPIANDFGYELTSIEDVMETSDEQIDDFVHHIGCVFKFVMLMERFEESLVLLKRRLGWHLQDILFLDLNKYKPASHAQKNVNISEEDIDIFKIRNRIDYKIYEYFKNKFERQFDKEDRISEEVDHFASILEIMHSYCAGNETEFSPLQIVSSEWSSAFNITGSDCELMATPELNMVQVMQQQHRVLLDSKQ